MNVFVLGAGVSKTAGYPLTSELLGELTEFVKKHPEGADSRWALFLDWLHEKRPNFLVAESGRQSNVEYLLTTIDLYMSLKRSLEENMWGAIWSRKPATKFWKKKAKMLEMIQAHRDVLYSVLARYLSGGIWEKLIKQRRAGESGSASFASGFKTATLLLLSTTIRYSKGAFLKRAGCIRMMDLAFGCRLSTAPEQNTEPKGQQAPSKS